jgi:putative phage-type endonuclease
MDKLLILNKYGLADVDTDLELIEIPKAESDWQDARVSYIGGSDTGAILRLNPYNSPMSVYKQKVYNKHDPEIAKKPAVIKGKELEDWILENKVKPYFKNYNIVKPTHIFKNKSFPWFRSNLDGLGTPAGPNGEEAFYTPINETIGIEIKFVTTNGEHNWDLDPKYGNIPAYYYSQVQQYMLVTGVKVFYVCALFDSDWTFKVYEIPYNHDFVNNRLVPETKKFWEDNVLLKIPPTINPKVDTEELLDAMKDLPEPHEDMEYTALVQNFEELSKTIRQAEKERDELKNKVIQGHLEGKRVIGDADVSINVSSITRLSFDVDRFRQEHPEMYGNYSTPQEFVRCQTRKKK